MNYTRYGVNSNTGTNWTATKRICNTQAQQHKNTVLAALLHSHAPNSLLWAAWRYTQVESLWAAFTRATTAAVTKGVSRALWRKVSGEPGGGSLWPLCQELSDSLATGHGESCNLWGNIRLTRCALPAAKARKAEGIILVIVIVRLVCDMAQTQHEARVVIWEFDLCDIDNIAQVNLKALGSWLIWDFLTYGCHGNEVYYLYIYAHTYIIIHSYTSYKAKG